MANKPLILGDNLLDDTVLHPDHVITISGTEVVGSELYHVADNTRDITRFTWAVPNTATGHFIYIDCRTPKPASVVIFDRAHNMAGYGSWVAYSDDGVSYTDIAGGVLPTVPGGLPPGFNASGCLTPEGVHWRTWPVQSHRYWRIWCAAPSATVAPVLTGVYLGAGYRFPEYLDGPAAYDYRINHRVFKNESTWTGARMKRRPVNYAEVNLAFKLEAEDFPAFHENVKRLLYQLHPWWFCLDDSDVEGAGLMRLFQLPGDTVYDPIANPVHREVKLLLEEVAPLVTL